jgi:hypothetical protein
MTNSRAKSIKHVHVHEAVIGNEGWYGDGPPLMHPSLSAAKTAKRQVNLVDLLEKAANKSKGTGDRKKARVLKRLAAELDRCRRGDRCGSLACPECARAFQRAKTAAQQQLFSGAFRQSSIKTADVENSVIATLDPEAN